ncbi:MAG: NAD-dependent epimerase/dehydratase family protein [Bacteroidota bacterium]|nr:NAD-dependent epimerase/dehydratase family protein [Bacteroidota bacterium]
MKIFLTGGTGFIGRLLVKKLAEEGNEVRLLLRNPEKSKGLNHPGISFIPGDLDNIRTLEEGMNGCDRVFHLAAYAKPWSKDPDLPYRTNVIGTINVLEAALKNHVQRVVVTSTAGTMGYSENGVLVSEKTNRNPEYHSIYEKTKALAEEKAREYAACGLHVVIVNPSRVYGPGLLSVSNSVTKMIKYYTEGIWRIIPGDGQSIGNYVFVDDVVTGHILAAETGKPGERYLLGGQNISFNEFFELLGNVTGKKRFMIHLAPWLMKSMASGMENMAKLTGICPLITKAFLEKYLCNWGLDCTKSKNELGYKYCSIEEGIMKTLMWLKNN